MAPDGWVRRECGCSTHDGCPLHGKKAAPPDPRHEGLRERIEEWRAVLRGRDTGHVRSAPDFWVAQTAWAKRLLTDCLAALEPAAPQPSEREPLCPNHRREAGKPLCDECLRHALETGAYI